MKIYGIIFYVLPSTLQCFNIIYSVLYIPNMVTLGNDALQHDTITDTMTTVVIRQLLLRLTAKGSLLLPYCLPIIKCAAFLIHFVH